MLADSIVRARERTGAPLTIPVRRNNSVRHAGGPAWLRSIPAPSMVLTVLRRLGHLMTTLVDFLSPRARLAAENLLLRQQLVILRRSARRPRFKPRQRRLFSSVAVRWSALQSAAWRCGGGENPNADQDVRQSHRSCAR